ncbi:MAG: glutamate synthase subunit beta [Deltaproteobacteria bacterium]|nr:glutamate synthase subunit beta [Deltaproteobacteria bacterium]
MGNTAEVMEPKRKDPGYRPVAERLNDYEAVERQLHDNDVMIQSSRCMACGTPFCHAYGCPLSNVIPEFNDCARRGQWREGLEILLSTNNFPEFTGRVCPAPCEAACVDGIHDDPVTIRQIELFLIGKAFLNGDIGPAPPKRRSDKKVAVIGSGPAGLAVADTLNKAGYSVTVYESARYPGGILRYGIPDFKLEKWVVERRVSLMRKEGVIFETGVIVGEDLSYRFLKQRFDAICMACGAGEARDLKIPGRQLQGVHFAMDYLIQQNRRNSGEIISPAEKIHAAGKKVLVIGGGDTGSDCVGTALRQGAKEVWQFEILPEPPVERPPTTPWPVWPQILRTTHAHKEGGKRRWAVMTQTFLGKKDVVSGVECVEVDWTREKDGRLKGPVEKPGTGFKQDVDLVILAMGFTAPTRNRIVDNLGVHLNDRRHIQTDDLGMTSVEGIFAAGDMALGQSLVVKAIADGRRTAKGIMKFLGEKKSI